MKRTLIIFLYIFFLAYYLNAQDNISGCFEFKLIEYSDSEGKPLTGELKERFECLYSEMVCFDTLVTVKIPMYNIWEDPMRIVYNRKTKIQYIFRSDSLGKYVTIDSSYLNGERLAEDITEGYEATDSVKTILGFTCTRYINKIDKLIKYERYIASDVIGWRGVKGEATDIVLPMILETRSTYLSGDITINGAFNFIKPANPQLLSLDLSGYKIVSQAEWDQIRRSK